jgi:hypothetical protein
MTQASGRKSTHGGKILIALFATTVALSGAQALAPTQAAAVNSDNDCSGPEWLGVCVPLDGDPSGSGNDSSTKTGGDGVSTGPLYCSSAPSPEEVSCSLEPPKDDDVWKSRGSGSKSSDNDDRGDHGVGDHRGRSAVNPEDGFWTRFRKRLRRIDKDWSCDELRANIKGRIRWVYRRKHGIEANFDWVNNPSDDYLREYENRWLDARCDDVDD